MVQNYYLVTRFIPVTNEKIEFGFWFQIWYLDDWTMMNPNRTKSPTSFEEIDGGKVGKSPNLILELEHISPVCKRLNGAICAGNSILPRVSSLLYPIPTTQFLNL